jgi:alkylhydroperoxidase family enzyme
MTTTQIAGTGFLAVPDPTSLIERLYADSAAQHGYVMDLTGLWAHQPALHAGLFDLIGGSARAAGLTVRQRAVLVVACASEFGDSYCAFAWGNKLAGAASPEIAGGVVRGDDEGLEPAERALARWARTVARAPASTQARDLQPLRDAGYDDTQIFAITAFVAFRLAFAIVNDALGAQPDAELFALASAPVRDAVHFGRPVTRSDHT